MDLEALARQLGTTVDSLPGDLDILLADVRGDDRIGDDHPRFGEHVGLLTWAQDTWPDVESMLDRAVVTGGDPAMNQAMRVIIHRIRPEL